MEKGINSIKYWADDDKPREKLMMKGRTALSDAELIAILIGSGIRGYSALDMAKDLLYNVNNDLHRLGKLHIDEFCKHKGMGPAKAVALIAALELGRRRKESEATKSPRITSSKDAYTHLVPFLADLEHEEFWVVCLSQSNHILHTTCISKGGIVGTVVDVRVVFREALTHRAPAIILSHNHPSGSLEPSDPDRHLTKKIIEAGKLMDIKVLDHIIVAGNGYVSFADNGWM